MENGSYQIKKIFGMGGTGCQQDFFLIGRCTIMLEQRIRYVMSEKLHQNYFYMCLKIKLFYCQAIIVKGWNILIGKFSRKQGRRIHIWRCKYAQICTRNVLHVRLHSNHSSFDTHAPTTRVTTLTPQPLDTHASTNRHTRPNHSTLTPQPLDIEIFITWFSSRSIQFLVYNFYIHDFQYQPRNNNLHYNGVIVSLLSSSPSLSSSSSSSSSLSLSSPTWLHYHTRIHPHRIAWHIQFSPVRIWRV